MIDYCSLSSPSTARLFTSLGLDPIGRCKPIPLCNCWSHSFGSFACFDVKEIHDYDQGCNVAWVTKWLTSWSSGLNVSNVSLKLVPIFPLNVVYFAVSVTRMRIIIEKTGCEIVWSQISWNEKTNQPFLFAVHISDSHIDQIGEHVYFYCKLDQK